MFTQGSYLRVLTPRTTNGNNLMVEQETGKVQYKETHLPMSAKFNIETLNKSLPQHLRKKIEVVKGNVQNANNQQDEELINAKKQIELLQKQLQQAQQVKPGAVAATPTEGASKATAK